jgi:hypothetical protein
VGCYSRPFMPLFTTIISKVIPALFRTSYSTSSSYSGVIPGLLRSY